MDVARKLGIPRERFREWLVRGFIRPSIQQASGSGTRNLFSRWDMYLIALFQHLIERGLGREEASAYVNALSDRPAVINHIVFKIRTSDNGETEISIIDIPPDEEEPRIDIRTGNMNIWFDQLRQMIEAPDEEYDEILIVNFGKIRRTVDRKLA